MKLGVDRVSSVGDVGTGLSKQCLLPVRDMLGGSRVGASGISLGSKTQLRASLSRGKGR